MKNLKDDDPSGWPTFVFHKTTETQVCPCCGTEGPFSPRHSPYVCLKCSRDIENERGERMVFADLNYSRRADDDPKASDSWISYSSDDAFYLHGRPVTVYDGRFGGWVVKYRGDEAR